jgi:hypothetical protein
MGNLAARISPMLHLTRLATAFAVVGNVWFVILWTRGVPEEHDSASSVLLDTPLWQLLIGGGVVGVGLYAFATALNDTLDLRRDRALNPDRPLPSGQFSLDGAVRVVAGALILAMLGAILLGDAPVLMALAVAFAAVVFNAAAKYVPSVGLVLLGLIYAGHMLIPNVNVRFVWPVWLAMTHALIVGALVHRMANRRPRLDPAGVLSAAAGWLVWSVALGWLQVRRTGSLWPEWVSPYSLVFVVGLALIFAGFVWAKANRRGATEARAAARLQRYGSLWLPLYAVGWLLGEGLVMGGLILGGLAVAGVIGMTLLREVFSLVEEPPGYRR